jgi:hypothetical protein
LDVIRHASGIQPFLFATLVVLRTLIRLLYFLASVLPFKILLVLGSGYTVPAMLQPYFDSKGAMAYSLCLTIGLSILGAKSCEHLVDAIKQQKARTYLGDRYTQRIRRRNNLISIISRATDACSAIIIATLSIVMLLYFHHQMGAASVISSILCIGVVLVSQGNLRNYIVSSPLKYLEKCTAGVSLVAFMILVHTSLNAAVPPAFLSLVVCLILIRQYCLSIEQIVAVTFSFREDEKRLNSIFEGLS